MRTQCSFNPSLRLRKNNEHDVVRFLMERSEEPVSCSASVFFRPLLSKFRRHRIQSIGIVCISLFPFRRLVSPSLLGLQVTQGKRRLLRTSPLQPLRQLNHGNRTSLRAAQPEFCTVV